MKKWFMMAGRSLCIALLLSLLWILLRWSTFADLSITPYDPRHLDEKVYLITYADGPEVFFRNQNALAHSALNRGVDFIFNYRRHHLDKNFLSQNATIMNDKAGAGRWLWKPYIILDALRHIPEGAYVIYLDSGFVLKKNITTLLEYMGQADIMAVSLEKEIYGLLGHHIQREALVLAGCDSLDCRQAPHLWAGLSFYRNSPKSRAFVERWLKLSENPRILIPQKSLLQEYPGFCYHHNDQSTFGMTAYLMKGDVTLLPHKVIHSYLAWHHRHAGDEIISLIGQMHEPLRGIEKKIMNSPILLELKSWIWYISRKSFFTKTQQ